ncbi:MAG: (d)CMP kinase [Halieaceae bacterium]|nr:(d)CMP kinase [Halieaceae bacterium]
MTEVPVITIDGPSGAGKGTVAHMLAEKLGWHLLDSGSLYRVTAFACLHDGVGLEDEHKVAEVARHLDVRFEQAASGEVLVFYRDVDASRAIRTEEGGRGASTVGAMALVREALLQRQRDFAQPPGLVADGRDMGTVVFPEAPLKFFLTASAEERARRRYKQLIDKGESVSLPRLLRDIEERDERDRSRSVSPLLPADDAILIDSSATPIDAVFEKVMADVNARFGT